jgi:hypothetical protein
MPHYNAAFLVYSTASLYKKQNPACFFPLIILSRLINCCMQLVVIQSKIHEIRGQKVMLDYDLAELYDVETRILNQAVKRNSERFPKDFMFQLTAREWNKITTVENIVHTMSERKMNSSQFVMSSLKHRSNLYLPYAFTEHGITMLASILKSRKAIKMNIDIVRAFIALRQFAMEYKDLSEQIRKLRKKTGDHDEQLKQIYITLENMLDKRSEEDKWQGRQRIGFKRNAKS